MSNFADSICSPVVVVSTVDFLKANSSSGSTTSCYGPRYGSLNHLSFGMLFCHAIDVRDLLCGEEYDEFESRVELGSFAMGGNNIVKDCAMIGSNFFLTCIARSPVRKATLVMKPQLLRASSYVTIITPALCFLNLIRFGMHEGDV